MKMELTILGSNSATPTSGRFPSAQILNCNDRLFMIDCGEGTQMQMRHYGIRFSKIHHIFISHLHGDHYLGLAGLLFTFHLFGRTEPLHIYANELLNDIIEMQLKASESTLLYPIHFHPLPLRKSKTLFSDSEISIRCFPLKHRVPTHGFVFTLLKKMKNIKPEKINQYRIPTNKIMAIKNGADFITEKGMVVKNSELTLPEPQSKTYAYCSDTAFAPEICKYFKNADLLYHESTFMNDKLSNAVEKQHSTAEQAATTAKLAGAKKLLIGHYSARYDDLMPMLDEACSVFPNTFLSVEGEKHII